MLCLTSIALAELPAGVAPLPAGNPIRVAAGAVAAIAAAHGLAVATRNGRDFKGTGVELIDPWAAAR